MPQYRLSYPEVVLEAENKEDAIDLFCKDHFPHLELEVEED